MTTYFLDTTAHIERHAGDRQRRNEVEQRLDSGDSHATSTHVQREWRQIVEGSAVDVLNVLADGKTDFRELWAHLSQGHGRAAGQRLRVLAMLSGQRMSTQELRIRAQTFLRSQADELFMHRISTVRNGSECGLAQVPVKTDAQGRRDLQKKCSKHECVCRQPEFLEDRRQNVGRVGVALEASSNSALRRLGQKVTEVMARPNPIDRKGQNCWGGLGGDVSIALECAEGETLLTTDRSFDVICPTLGIEHERIRPTTRP